MAKPRKHPKKVITEADFNEAYKNTDNQNIIHSVLKKYYNALDVDTLKNCGLKALLRCLESHSEEYKTKFTSSLYRFTTWECERERKAAETQSERFKPMELFDIPVGNGREASIFDDLNDVLPEEHASIIKMKFEEDRTLEEIGKHFGYTKEAARQKLKSALTTLREVYKDIRIG